MAEFKTNELGELILKILFTGEETPPDTYYLGAGTGTVPDDPNTTLADITEVTGPGYARQALSRGLVDFPALSLGLNGWSLTSLYKSFAATGDWTEMTYLFLCDVASGTAGRLFAIGDTDPFDVAAGDSFDAAYQHTEFTG